MVAFFSALTAAALVAAPIASALTITSPSSGGWEGNTTVLVSWTWNQDDPTFSIELGNPEIHEGLLAQGPIAVANNIQPNIESFSFQLPVVFPGDQYWLAFVAIDNVNSVYANTSYFPIRSNPKSSTFPISSQTSTAAGTKQSSTSHTSTGVNSTVSTPVNGTQTSTVLVTSTTGPSSSFTTLAVTTLSTSATATSTSGAATRMEAAWYVGVVTAMLGAVFA